MASIISFPGPATATTATTVRRRAAAGARTLFLHIRTTSLIVHLAAPRTAALRGGRVGKRS